MIPKYWRESNHHILQMGGGRGIIIKTACKMKYQTQRLGYSVTLRQARDVSNA